MQWKKEAEVFLLRNKAAPEIIKAEFDMSKNAFKRAVGRLLKEGKIEIAESCIKLKK